MADDTTPDNSTTQDATPKEPSLADQIQAKASDLLDFHKHLNDYYQVANAAAHGDPNAQQQTAENSLGMAMGTIQSVPAEAAEGLAAKGLEAAQHNLNAVHEATQAGSATAIDLARAQQLQGRAQAFAERAASQRAARRGFADGGVVSDTQPAAATPDAPPPEAGVNVFNPEGDLVSIAPHQLNDALQGGYTQASPDDVQNYALQQKYGGVGQTIAAGAEGAAEGATFGLSAPAELALGITTPNAMAGRAAASPLAHNIGQVTGLAGSALIPGVGQAELLGKAGQGVADVAGLGKTGAGFLNQVAADTVKGAFEAALFQGTSEEIPRAFTEDPDKFAQSAIADIGLAGVMGGVFSGTIGAALRKAGMSGAESMLGHPTLGGEAAEESTAAAATKPTRGTFVSEIDMPKMEAGDLKTSIENSNILKPEEKENIISGLTSLKPNSKEIESAAKEIGAEIAPGMLSDSKFVQKATDSLINGAPTYSGLKVARKYSEGYNIANKAVDDVVGAGSQYSKAEVGNLMKSSIADQIKEQAAPITDMYNEIKKYHGFIPLSEEAVPGLTKEIQGMKEIKLSPSSPGAKLAKDVLSEIGNIKTVDDIKMYNSALWDRLPPTASTSEKHMVSTISDALKRLENESVETFAKNMPMNDEAKAVIQSLVEQRKTADSAYKPFIKKIQTLADQLGKSRISGAQSAINFLTHELTPEQVTNKLFAKNNSEFLKFFKKEFPEQFEMMRQYQKGVLRDEAVSKETGQLNPKTLFNKVNKLEPEIQKSLFSPAELKKLQAAETYLQAFPKRFNPSGTADQSAFRSFFEHGVTGGIISNARDFGIEQFIKHVGSSPEVTQATALARATSNGFKAAQKAIKAIMNPDNATMPAALAPSIAARNKLKGLVLDIAQDPGKLNDINHNNPVEDYKQPFALTASRAAQYLNSIRPVSSPSNPLDTHIPPPPGERAAYDRQVDLANNPNLILNHIKQGNLIPQDIKTISTIYPNYYQHLSQKLTDAIGEQTAKGKIISYKTRIGMSLFLGRPLDSTMTPMSIQAAQPVPQDAQPPQQGSKPPSSASQKGIQKLPSLYRTPSQASAADKTSRGER